MKSLHGIVGELVGLRAQERMHHELHAEAVIVQPVAAELLEVEVVRVAIVDVRVYDRAVRPRVVVIPAMSPLASAPVFRNDSSAGTLPLRS